MFGIFAGLMKSVSGAVTDMASSARAEAMSSGSVDKYHRFENETTRA